MDVAAIPGVKLLAGASVSVNSGNVALAVPARTVRIEPVTVKVHCACV